MMVDPKKKKGFATEYLKDMLSKAMEPISYNEYYDVSRIQHKATFSKYIKWLVEKGYLSKRRKRTSRIYHGRLGDSQRIAVLMMYKTTPEGKAFLEMIL